jgi:hypothetical protein
MRPIAAPILVSLALVGAACSGGDDSSAPTTTSDAAPTDTTGTDPGTGGGGPTGFVRRLTPFDDCSALLDHLKREASERVGPYGLDGNGGWPVPFLEGDIAFEVEESAEFDTAPDVLGADEPADESFDAPATGGDDGGAGDASTKFSDTNVQELGVGEPDIIKTDGERIVVISENVLSLVTLDGGAEITDQLVLPEGWNHELFFSGDRAFVLTNGGSWGYPMPVEPLDAVATDAEAQFADESAEEIYIDHSTPAALVLEIDLSDPNDLEIAASMRIEGQYLSARAVDDIVRFAVSSGPDQLPWLFPSGPASEERAREANQQVIDDSTLDDWLPSYELTSSGSSDEGQLLPCDRTHYPTEFAGFDVISVVEFDLGQGLAAGLGERDAVGVLAGGQTVYSSLDRFYVATTSWAPPRLLDDGDMSEWIENYTTGVHAFSISSDDDTEYVASGEIDGTLLNQFSLDEHDGYLRVITTTGTPWSSSDQTESQLVVLAEDGDELVEVGQVGGLGRGEQLYAARLLDDVGFAVTFRQVDPFYVLDLRDPTNPTITGELKIPGFSTYLHPVNDDLVLGIGQDADEFGGTLGLKVSLFDVSDPADPREVDVWTIPNANSPAEYDHRAFQMWGSYALLPVQSWGGSFNGVYVLDIGEASISEVGRITHRGEAELEPGCRKLELDDVPTDSELFWMMADSYQHVQVCDGDSGGGFGSTWCDSFSTRDLEWMIWDAEQLDATIERLDIDPDDRIEICYPNDDYRAAIQRSLVVGDTIWTMSPRGLQGNALDSLDVTDSLQF